MAYASVFCSGLAFLLSTLLLLIYRFKNILPSDQELASIYFEQFKQEIYLAYALIYLATFFAFWSLAWYFYLIYTTTLIIVTSYIGLFLSAAAIPGWLLYQYKTFNEATTALEKTSDTDKIQAALDELSCGQYVKRLSAAKVAYTQLFELSVDELVNYINIPLGDAKRIVAGLEISAGGNSGDDATGGDEGIEITENAMYHER